MAWPSDLLRTKNWGTETLTDADLEGQLDLIINWVMAMMSSTTGHAHLATANDSQKISAITGLKIASQAQGDILYASSASAFARLGAGTAGQALTTAGAAANPAWAGMTTQGDIEYHNGTTRTRLGPGTAGQVLETQGAAANPAWATRRLTKVNTLFDDSEVIASGGTSATISITPDAISTVVIKLNAFMDVATGDMQLVLEESVPAGPTTIVSSFATMVAGDSLHLIGKVAAAAAGTLRTYRLKNNTAFSVTLQNVSWEVMAIPE